MHIRTRIKGRYVKEVGILKGTMAADDYPRMITRFALAARCSTDSAKQPGYSLCVSEDGTGHLTEITLILQNLIPFNFFS